MKLGGRCTKISAEFEFGGHSSWVCVPEECGVRLRCWEDQCTV